jgi:signal transduction histidine kinase
MTEHKLLASYRDEITNMAVHDLRGPLGSIISSLTLAVEIIDDPQDMPLELTLGPSLEVSLDSANHLLGLVDSLLDIAKMETRQLPIKRAPWAINELIESGLKALSRLYQEAGLTVERDIPSDLPLVNVDEDKIRRVIINLLDNALRYSPEGGTVRVDASLVENGRKVQVRVADSGKGIPPEERDRVFEKFRQIKDNAPERGRKGSGLGLTFCKLAIEAHGCQIWVEEQGPLSGASFVFTLPIFFENRNNT